MRTSLRGSGRGQLILTTSLLFLIVFAFVILKSARDALFLSHYSARSLPYFMALNTGVSAIAATVSIRLYKRVSLSRLAQFTLIFFSVGTFLFWEGFTRGHFFLPALLYLWVGIVGTIAPVQGWSLVSQQFSTREAKRVMGVVSAGATLGAIAGGLFARLFAGAWNAITLIPVGGVTILVASFACSALSSPRAEAESIPSQEPETLQVRKRFLILLAALVALGTVASAFIDFQFKSLTQQQLGSAEDLARFFGSFYAITAIMTLILQIALIPVFLKRFRVWASLLALPLCLFLLNGFLLATGSFVSIVLLRGGDEVLKHSMGRSSLEVLYVAIPERTRIRMKTLIDTIGVRVPELLASGMLILLFSIANSPVQFLTLINAGVLLLCLSVSWILGRAEYTQVLKEQLEKKAFQFDTLRENLFTGEFYRMLPELFRNAEKEMALHLLDLLEASRKHWLGRYLLVALNREEPEIRLRSLRLLFDQDANLSHQVKVLCEDRDARIRREAIHYLCLRSRITTQRMQKFATDADAAVRVACCAFQLRSSATRKDGHRRMETLLEESLEKEHAEVRLEIAHVLEYGPGSAAAAPLYDRLLADPSEDVRIAALKSIACTKPPGVVPSLLSLSRNPVLKRHVRAALAGFGESLIPLLANVAENNQEGEARRKLALNVASDIGEQSASLLLRMARHHSPVLRFSAIKSLNRLKKNNKLGDVSTALLPLLREEIEALDAELCLAKALCPKQGDMLDKVLRQRAGWTLERIFRLLGLLYDADSIYFAYLAWNSSDIRRADTALELLEQTVAPDVRELFFPVLESLALHQTQPAVELERKEALLSCLRQGEPLLASAAIHDLDLQELSEWEAEIRGALSHTNHPLISEILHRRYNSMNFETGMQETESPLTSFQKMEHLGRINMFSKLDPAELLLLAELAKERRFEPDEPVCVEGQAPCFLSLYSGEMRILLAGAPGALINAGECVGLLELLRRRPFPFSCVAVQSCVCLTIDRDSFQEVLEDHTSICLGILETFAEKIDTQNGSLFDAQNSVFTC